MHLHNRLPPSADSESRRADVRAKRPQPSAPCLTPTGEQAAPAEPRRLRLDVWKDGHSYGIEYDAGTETEVVCALMSWALDSRLNFDLSDAAAVMHALKKTVSSS